MSRRKYLSANYRTYRLTEPLYGSRTGDGLIIADLLNDDGSLYRTAVVADCRTKAGAEQWLSEHKENKCTQL